MYNSKGYIERALNQLINQTIDKEKIEILIIDDGSNDGSEIICDEYAKKHSFIHVYHQKNSGGPSGPRNFGIKNAKGKYVFFHDADDYLGIEAAERMVKHAQEWNSDVLLAKMASPNREVPVNLFKKSQPKVDIYNSYVMKTIGPWKLFRLDFLKKNKIVFSENVFFEDLLFIMKAYFSAKTVSVASDYDYYYWCYREDSGNLTLKKSKISKSFSKLDKRIKALNLFKEICDKYNDKTKPQYRLKEKVLSIISDTLIFALQENSDEKELQELQVLLMHWYDKEFIEKSFNIKEILLLETLTKTYNKKVLEEIFNLPTNRFDKLIYSNNNKLALKYISKTDKNVIVDINLANISYNYKEDYLINSSSWINNNLHLNFTYFSFDKIDKSGLYLYMVPTDNFEKIVKIKLNKISEVKDIQILTKFNAVINFDFLYKFAKKNNLIKDLIIWKLYLCNDDFERKKKLGSKREKNVFKSFVEKVSIVDNNIFLPDEISKSLIVRQYKKNPLEDNIKKYFDRPINNKLICSALTNKDFDLSLQLAKDIQNNNVKLKFSILKGKITYTDGKNKIVVKNNYSITNYFKKIKRKFIKIIKE